jgi:hypothetical protein
MRVMVTAPRAMAMATKRAIVRKRAMGSNNNNKTMVTKATTTTKTIIATNTTTRMMMMMPKMKTKTKTKTTTEMTTMTVRWQRLVVAGGGSRGGTKAAVKEVECSYFFDQN